MVHFFCSKIYKECHDNMVVRFTSTKINAYHLGIKRNRDPVAKEHSNLNWTPGNFQTAIQMATEIQCIYNKIFNVESQLLRLQ